MYVKPDILGLIPGWKVWKLKFPGKILFTIFLRFFLARPNLRLWCIHGLHLSTNKRGMLTFTWNSS